MKFTYSLACAVLAMGISSGFVGCQSTDVQGNPNDPNSPNYNGGMNGQGYNSNSNADRTPNGTSEYGNYGQGSTGQRSGQGSMGQGMNDGGNTGTSGSGAGR